MTNMTKNKTIINLLNNIHTNIFDSNIIKKRTSILIAISGGQDSICLFFIFIQLKKQWQCCFGIIYCNHLWQINSFYTGSLILKIAYIFNISIYYVTTADKVFNEQTSRDWRYTIFYRIIFFYNYKIISSGHTASDKTETILFQFIRGTSLKSLVSLNTVKYFSSCNQFTEKFQIKNLFIYLKKNLNVFFTGTGKTLVFHQNYLIILDVKYVKKNVKIIKKNVVSTAPLLKPATMEKFNFVLKNPPPEGRSHPLPEGRSHPLPEGRSHPLPEGRSHPLSEGRSHPLPEGRSHPLSEGRSHPLPEGRSHPLPEGRSHPLPERRSHPLPEGRSHPLPEGWSQTSFSISINKQNDFTSKNFVLQNKLVVLPCLKQGNGFNKNPIKNKYFLIRPILVLNRFDIKKLFQYFDLPIYPDVSNQKKTYYRNRIRKELIPALKFFFNPQIHSSFFQFSEILINEQFHLNLLFKQLIIEFYIITEKKIILNIAFFQNLPIAIRTKLVKKMLEDCTSIEVDFAKIEKIIKLLLNYSHQNMALVSLSYNTENFLSRSSSSKNYPKIKNFVLQNKKKISKYENPPA